MTRKKEIQKAAEDYYNEVKYLSDLSAFPIAAFKAGAEWADKTIIERACEWLKFNLQDYAGFDTHRNQVPFDKDIFADFRKAMEGISPYYVPKSGIPLP